MLVAAVLIVPCEAKFSTPCPGCGVKYELTTAIADSRLTVQHNACNLFFEYTPKNLALHAKRLTSRVVNSAQENDLASLDVAGEKQL